MKKILSLVLVIAMMASLVVFAPAASAETVASVEVTDTVAQQGDTVTLTVIVTAPTLYGFTFAIDYDEARLENPVTEMVDTKLFPMTTTRQEFPYASATFGSMVDSKVGGAFDASAGYSLFTITLDVKEKAPAGDAFVRIAPVADTTLIAIYPTNDTSVAIRDWTVIEGTVTVLPDGCSKAFPAEIDTSLLDYEENDAGTGIVINGFMDDSYATLVIPAYIDGLPVVEIAEKAFRNDDMISFVVVPETVTVIAKQALQGIAENAVVYVLSENVDLSANTPIEAATIYSSATSTAKTYAEDKEYAWAEYNAPTAIVTVDVDGTLTSFGASNGTITAPGASRVDGRVTVAWDVNGTKVAPGAEVAIDGDTTFTAITVAAPETTYGASIKAADGYAALRFTAEFSMEEYEALVTAFGAESVKHGMLISTQDQIKAAGEFTHNVAKKLDFKMTGCWKKENGNYIFAASVKNFTDKTIANNYDFNAVAYVGIDVDGNGTVDTYVYGDYDWTCARDAKTVLGNYVADLDPESDVYGWVNTWYSKFN